MRGRKPKPTRLKILTGNLGKRPLNSDEPALPDRPPELGPAARKEWDGLFGELAKLRMPTNLDRAALAACCNAYSLWAEAAGAIQKYGVMIKSPTGFPIQSSYVSIANRQAEIMMKMPSLASRQRAGEGSTQMQTIARGLIGGAVIALAAGMITPAAAQNKFANLDMAPRAANSRTKPRSARTSLRSATPTASSRPRSRSRIFRD